MLSALAMNSHYLWWCRNIPGKQLEKLSLEMNHRADFCLWLLDKHHASWRSLVEQLLPSVPADLTLLPPHCLRDEDSYVISRSGNLKAIPGSYKIISNCEYNRTEFKFDPQILPRSNKGGICPACQTLCVFADPKVRQPARYEIYETEDMGNGARALEVCGQTCAIE